jgi:hypothetical protein
MSGHKDKEVEFRIKHIKEYPEKHRHDFSGLTACCTINGTFYGVLQEAHEDYAPLGRNGGQVCDVTSGPCSCGAWH